jgi:hypothetical protein
MNKPMIKIIKRTEGDAKTPPPRKKRAKDLPKKERSVAATIQSWITERRENDDAERRSRVDSWNTDSTPVEAV